MTGEVTNVRTCPQCGARLAVSAQHARDVVRCLRCNGTVPPLSTAPTAAPPPTPAPLTMTTPEQPEATRHLDSVAGWGVSLALHALLLLTFTAVTWVTSGVARKPEPEEDEAGVVLEEETPRIDPGEAKPIEVAGSDSALQLPEFKATTTVRQIPSLAAKGDSSTGTEALIGLDMGGAGGAGSAMKGSWGDLAGGGALGGGGGGTSFFGVQGTGGKFVFVIDHSGSMTGDKLVAAKAELIRSIKRLSSGKKFYIIFFTTRHMAMPASDLVRATAKNKKDAFAWVKGVPAGGGTDPTSAMQLALSLKPNTIFLLSDGNFHFGAADAIRLGNPKKRVHVHTIAFFDDSGKAVLKRIAAENKGQYRFVPPTAIPGVRRHRP